MSEKNLMIRRTLPQNEEDEFTIDLVALFWELVNHWKVIALSTLLVAAIAFSYCRFLVTPVYESTSELYVLTKSTSITSLADLQIGSNLSDDYLVVISGRPVLEQVIQDMQLPLTYDTIRSKVSVSNLSDRIITITVRDTDPAMAKRIADQIATVAASYISQMMDQDPPSVIQNGYSDGDPVTPRTMRTTAIGAILGFLMAAGVVVLQSLMNDTIMTAEDVENKLGINVLGSLPLEEAEDDGVIHRSRKSGKDKKNERRKPQRKSA